MSELPYDPIDELLHRAHNEAQGAPASFKGRLHARMAAEATVRRQSRLMLVKVGVAIAAVLVLAVAVGLSVNLFVPEKPAIEPQPQAKANEPAPEPVKPAPETPTTNEPAVNQPEQPGPEPTPEPEPKPEPKPDDQVDQKQPPNIPDEPKRQPEPEPQPIKPDATVEQPKPQPQPPEPESTEAKPDKPVGAVLATRLGDAKFQLRYGNADWADYTNQELRDGACLKAGRDSVDLQLAGGGLARFNGEIELGVDGDGLRFWLADDSLYVDNLNTGRGVQVLGNGHTVAMPDSAGVVYAMHLALEAACLAGDVKLDDEAVAVGFSRRANKHGVGEAKAFPGDRFLKDLPERRLLREDFTNAPAGGMYGDGEQLVNGTAEMDKAPRYIAFNYDPTLTVLPGTLLRFRIRTTDVQRLELELFTEGEIKLLKRNKERMFKHTWKPARNGEWTEVSLRIEEIPDHDDPESFPTHGTLLRNFKLHFAGGEKAKLEIDWVEFVRVQE